MSDTYTGDAPIKDSKEDFFRRWPFAQRVAQTIAGHIDPGSIVIGIYGAWGEGKTTVLNFIEEELSNHSDVVCFRFNPWRFPDEAKLLNNFFTDLINALGKSLSTKVEKLGELVSKFGTAPASILGRGEAAKTLGQLLSSVELDKLRDRVERTLKEEGKRVVVLMDDIDRLDKIEIQAVFRLIKLTVDFNYTAYVLAFDNDMVSSALQERYGETDSNAGRNFLEKIVQVPLRLPSVFPASLTRFCFMSIYQALKEAQIELSEDDIRAFMRHFIDGLQIRLKTPRMAKRYGNILAFALPIMKGEVNTVDFMLIEGIRVFYPDLYGFIKGHPELFIGDEFAGRSVSEEKKKTIVNDIETALARLNSGEHESAISVLMALFPRLNSAFGNTEYGRDWDVEWQQEQRIASHSYFARYFSYAIPEGDFSDMDLLSFIQTLASASPEKISGSLKQLITPETADTVMAKLRSKGRTIASATSKNLALAIARNGMLFPIRRSIFTLKGSFSEAAMFISDLVANIPDTTERFSLACNLLHEAEPITFAVEIHRWLVPKRKDDLKSFSTGQQEELIKILAARIKQIATQGTPLITQFSEDIPILMEIWSTCRSSTETNEYIQKIIKTDPSLAVTFLKCYLPIALGIENALPFKGDFERTDYDSAAQAVKPDIIFGALQTIYSTKLNVEGFPYSDGTLSDERIAQQFTWLHNYVRQNAQEQQEPPEGANQK
ncbi:MAG: KAP family NTPase [Deltaproteobacteria bacterium]|nr:KAP family NTPase [Deltaproteobacteria bacterium]